MTGKYLKRIGIVRLIMEGVSGKRWRANLDTANQTT